MFTRRKSYHRNHREPPSHAPIVLASTTDNQPGDSLPRRIPSALVRSKAKLFNLNCRVNQSGLIEVVHTDLAVGFLPGHKLRRIAPQSEAVCAIDPIHTIRYIASTRDELCNLTVDVRWGIYLSTKEQEVTMVSKIPHGNHYRSSKQKGERERRKGRRLPAADPHSDSPH